MLKKRKRIIWAVVILAVLGAAAAASMNGAAEVRLHTVEKGAIREYVELRGKVELDEKQTVFGNLTGKIVNIMVGEGDRVSSGNELALMDVEDLDIALMKAQAGYDSARAALASLRRSIKPEEVKQAEAQVEQVKIALNAARKDYDYKKDSYDKTKTLFDNGVVCQQELKNAELLMTSAESTWKDTEQRLSIARYNLEMLNKGVSESDLQQAQANVELARLQVEELMNNRERTVIRSGVTGTVLKKHIEEGAAVQPGAPLFEVGNFDSAYIRVDVLADDAGKIKLGQKAVISGDVTDDKEIEGEVYYIAPRAESSISTLGVEQQRVEMKIRFENTALNLKPGYGVDVDIVTQEKQAVAYVPDKAVFDMDRQDTVFVIKGGKAELRSVTTGIESEDYIEVVEGLSEGEQVVVDPPNDLKPGMKVKGSK